MSNPFLTKVFHFNAAHQYGHDDWSAEKNWEVFGPDSKVHGHNYTLEVMVTAAVNPETGFMVDLDELKNIVKKYVLIYLITVSLTKKWNGSRISSRVRKIW